MWLYFVLSRVCRLLVCAVSSCGASCCLLHIETQRERILSFVVVGEGMFLLLLLLYFCTSPSSFERNV